MSFATTIDSVAATDDPMITEIKTLNPVTLVLGQRVKISDVVGLDEPSYEVIADVTNATTFQIKGTTIPGELELGPGALLDTAPSSLFDQTPVNVVPQNFSLSYAAAKSNIQIVSVSQEVNPTITLNEPVTLLAGQLVELSGIPGLVDTDPGEIAFAYVVLESVRMHDSTQFKIKYDASPDPYVSGGSVNVPEQFTIGGGASIGIDAWKNSAGQSASVNLTGNGAVVDGRLHAIDLTAASTGDFTIAGVTVAPTNLNLNYRYSFTEAAAIFTVGGGLRVTLPKVGDASAPTFDVTASGSISENSLQSFTASVLGTGATWSVGGLGLSPKAFSLTYVNENEAGNIPELKLGGTVGIGIDGLGSADVSISDATISENKLQGLKLTVQNTNAANTTATIVGVTNTLNPTITTSAPVTFVVGQSVTIAGVEGATGVNGTFTVASVTDSTHFSITQSGDLPAPGTYTSGGTVRFPLIISGVTNEENPTITLNNPVTLVAGQSVTISGVEGATGVNGTFEVLSAVSDQNSFRIKAPASGGNVPAPGDYTSGGVADFPLFTVGDLGITPEELSLTYVASATGISIIGSIQSDDPPLTTLTTGADITFAAGQLVAISGVAGLTDGNVRVKEVVDSRTFVIEGATELGEYPGGGTVAIPEQFTVGGGASLSVDGWENAAGTSNAILNLSAQGAVLGGVLNTLELGAGADAAFTVGGVTVAPTGLSLKYTAATSAFVIGGSAEH